MRRVFIHLLGSLAASAPAGAQAVVVPVRCPGGCPSGTLAVDSVHVSAHLERGGAATYVNHTIRNPSSSVIDAALLFPLPRDAEVVRASVTIAGKLLQYGDWSGPRESRWILEGIARDRPELRLGGYAAAGVAHFPVLAIPPHGTADVQIAYHQAIPAGIAPVAYRYPFADGAETAPAGHVRLVMTVKTEAGFRDIRSTSHTVDIQLGTEPGPCLPEQRCGTRGYPSERVRVIRLLPGRADQARDFELVYTPAEPGTRQGMASVP